MSDREKLDAILDKLEDLGTTVKELDTAIRGDAFGLKPGIQAPLRQVHEEVFNKETGLVVRVDTLEANHQEHSAKWVWALAIISGICMGATAVYWITKHVPVN